MASDLNKFIVKGRLTKDPELRFTQSGTAVCKFSIANNESFKKKDGEKVEHVHFFDVVVRNKLGELCNQFLAKGLRVLVCGRMTYRDWTTDDGVKRRSYEIVADDIKQHPFPARSPGLSLP